jgi:hypothetical protein
LLRFAVEAGLAARYGRRILGWMQSTVFETIVGVLIAVAVIGTVGSAVAVWRGTRRGSTGVVRAPFPSTPKPQQGRDTTVP